jgi:ATP-dependent Clp protease ATP-binding subunit ClpC
VQGYNFTERVRRILAMAREESVRLNHEYVGTEHILLGLIRQGDGVAIEVMKNLSANPDQVRDTLLGVLQKGHAPRYGGDLPYTTRAKRVLELAMTEVKSLGHQYFGSEHLFLGLLTEKTGIAAQVLVDAGVTLEKGRAETLRLLGTPPR